MADTTTLTVFSNVTTLDVFDNATTAGRAGPSVSFIIDLYNAKVARDMIVPIVYVASMMVFGLIGNSLVVYVYGFKWRNSPEKCFITALAIFDLVNCCITMPTEIATLVSFFRFNSAIFCKISRFSTFWMNNASVILLFAIAVDRFIKICMPNKQSFNYKKAKVTCFVSCVIGMCVSLPALVIYGNMTLPLPTRTGYINATLCNVADNMRNTRHPISFYIYLWVAFLAIALAMIILYSLIGIKIWHQKSKGDARRKSSLKASLRSTGSSSNHKENEVSLVSKKPIVLAVENTRSVELSDDCFDSGSSEEPKTSKREGVVKQISIAESQTSTARSRLKSITISKSGLQAGKATAMLFAITMVYILSFLPYLVITIMRTVYGDAWYPGLSQSAKIAVNLFLRSYLISNTGNVVVYGFGNMAFRTECAKIFRKMFCCRK